MLDAGYWILDTGWQARSSIQYRVSSIEYRVMDWQSELGSIISAKMKLHEPLAAHTSFRIGGPADVFAEIGDMDQLKKLISFCKSRLIPLLVIGRGTNLLIGDKGRRGVVAKLCGDFSQVKIGNQGGCSEADERTGAIQCVTTGAAVALPRLSRLTAERGLAGLEFAFGIPGSLGGALVMNAGARSHSIGNVVDSVSVITQDGNDLVLNRSELEFGYRRSNLRDYVCITEAHLHMRSGSPEEITARMKQFLTDKKASQPLSAASAGCVFKNPEGMSAGKLIDECGLKGSRVGGAQVSTQHANFIVNAGGATSADVLKLIDRIRSIVRERKGVDLELELKTVAYNG